ncbi:MAG: hypothetical protein IJY93_00040 [Clostridia bacterium]|nr:hypothetical protein [Clostridia bacterium]
MGEAFIMRRGRDDKNTEIEGFSITGNSTDTITIEELIGCRGFMMTINALSVTYGGSNMFVYSLFYLDGTVSALIRAANDANIEDTYVLSYGTNLFKDFDEETGTIVLSGAVFAKKTYAVIAIK